MALLNSRQISLLNIKYKLSISEHISLIKKNDKGGNLAVPTL